MLYNPFLQKEDKVKTEGVKSRYVEEEQKIEKTANRDFSEILLPKSSELVNPWFDDLNGNESMTIATAYWDLGSFRKGHNYTFTKQMYLDWMKSFAYMTNPLVVFTDSPDFLSITKKYRARFHEKTRIFFVKNRKILWPFSLIQEIHSIYSQPGYPKHHPNTVIPEYSAAQHVKYVVLAQTAKEKYFNTPFYAWLDVGYFRDITKNNAYYRLEPPNNFDKTRIAFNKVYNVRMTTPPKRIFRGNKVWVGGGLAFGTAEVIAKFEEMYHKAFLYFLEEKLMNTDQQVLFSLYSDIGRRTLNPEVELQIYNPRGSGNPWFYLGFLCLKKLENNKKLKIDIQQRQS